MQREARAETRAAAPLRPRAAVAVLAPGFEHRRPRPHCSGSGCAGPARIGSRTRWPGAKRLAQRRGQAARSRCRTPASRRARTRTSASACSPRVVKANSAPGRAGSASSNAGHDAWRANVGVLVVVEPGAAQQLVVHRKAERLHQVQRAAGVGRQPDHVAGVGRDLGFDQDDAEHGRGVDRHALGQRRARHHPHVDARARRRAAARARRRARWRRWSSRRRPAPPLRPLQRAALRAGSTQNASRRLCSRCCARHADLVRGVAAALQQRGVARMRSWRPAGAPAPRPGCSRARAAARATAAPAAAGRGGASRRRAAPHGALRSARDSAAASSTAAWNLNAAIKPSHGQRSRRRRCSARKAAGLAQASPQRGTAGRQRAARSARSAAAAARSAAGTAGTTALRAQPRHTAHRPGSAARRPEALRHAEGVSSHRLNILAAHAATDARIAPLAEFHEPAAQRRARARLRPHRAALAARRSGAPHGRAAADHPRSRRSAGSTGGRYARRQCSRGARRLSAGAAHRRWSPTRRCATAAGTLPPWWSRAALGPAGRGGRCCEAASSRASAEHAVGEHDAARVRRPAGHVRALAARAGARRLPDVLDPRPGHAAPSCAAVRSASAGGRRSIRSPTCTTSAICSCMPALPTR